ncbi:hypothetical protein L484_005916 [Morus notabilis]|uniref:Uncharacterized protein n=1 Tax=Morus notabilis TaxID=981085 RepID=W9QJ28_9ROSA|nr:hypothetical protein L484_005916 [Morus notabilis]
MPASRQFSRINTLELKSQIENKLGRQKAEMYFSLLTKYLSLKISGTEFHKLCGKHNKLVKSILKNASLSTTPPPKISKETGSLSIKVPNGFQRSGLQSLCRDFPQSPRKGRTPSLRDRKLRDRPSPLGPQGKSHCIPCEDSTPKIQEQHSASELLSLGSRPPCSDEDGEEVEQAAGSLFIHSRSPLTAPLGILEDIKKRRNLLSKRSASTDPSGTCNNNGELPDTSSLMKRLEPKLEMEGLKMSVDCANVLNNSLDVYLKRLIKPCLELAGSRSGTNHMDQGHGRVMHGLNGTWPMRYVEKPSRSSPASMLDFRVAMETNPTVLGEEWPRKLEKICFYASEDRTGI